MHNIDQHKKLNNDISIIVKEILSTYKRSIKAIILYGSYGRGEGAFYTGIDGIVHSYNDYDILLVVEEIIEPKVLWGIVKSLENKLDVRWIDISLKNTKQLKNIKLSIFNYDLKYGSYVIYGDMNILSLIPDMDARNISLKEAEILFFTRLWPLLGSLDSKGLDIERKGEESRLFRNQMAKAVLAIVDVLLLQTGQYHHSYKQRLDRLRVVYPGRTQFLKLAEWALNEKLEPNAPVMSPKEIKELYSMVHTHYFNEMFVVLSAYYKKSVQTPLDLERHLKWSTKNLIKRIGWIIVRRNLDWEKNISLKLAQAFIAFAYNKNEVRFLMQGIHYIKKMDHSFSEISSWDEARCKIASMRLG